MICKRIWGGSYCRTACLKSERVVKIIIVASFTIILQRSLVPYIILERIFFFFVCFCVLLRFVFLCVSLSPHCYLMCHSLLLTLSRGLLNVRLFPLIRTNPILFLSQQLQLTLKDPLYSDLE